MKKHIFSAAAFSVFLAGPASAQFTVDFLACADIPKDKDRLACFDKAAKEGDTDKSTKTSEAIKPSAGGDFKVVAAADLFVSPGKFEGKAIEVRNVRCFHADKQDYRCVAPFSNVMINALDVSPLDEKAAIEDQCGEVGKVATSSKCLKTIRFTPATHSEDTISGYQNRVLIGTKNIEIVSKRR